MTTTTTTTPATDSPRSTADRNVQIIQECYEAFQRGDIPAILAHCADDVSFGVIGHATRKAPWHFRGRGKAGAVQFFEALGGALEPIRFEPGQFAAAGEYVYATTQQEYRVRATGKTLELRDAIHRARLVRGRLVEFWASEDTEATNEVMAAK